MVGDISLTRGEREGGRQRVAARVCPLGRLLCSSYDYPMREAEREREGKGE